MTQKQIYRTSKGREIDMGKLISQNELVPAVGNMQVNARGDKLTPSVKIPGQINNTRPTPSPTPAPTSAPVQMPSGKKDLNSMDPEGNE
jgi:hypothetical protein